MAKHANITVSGNVQGVTFRESAKIQARDLGLTGFAKNEFDSTFYCEAEGEDEAVDEFIDWCHHGPQWAEVHEVEVEEGPLKNFDKFEVLY